VERARLEAADNAGEFIAASEEQVGEIQADVQNLRAQSVELADDVRMGAMVRIEELGREADELTQRVAEMADASAAEVDEARDELTEDIATLSAAVRRRMLDLHQDIRTQ
jgi:phage host-nuclease inhibitor protein Gam